MEDEMMNKMGRVMFESTVAFVKTMVRVNGKQASVAMMMANQEKLFKGVLFMNIRRMTSSRISKKSLG